MQPLKSGKEGELQPCSSPSSYRYENYAHFSTSQISEFISNTLSYKISGYGWQSLSAEPYVHKIADDFAIFVREREFASLNVAHFGDFENYESLRQLRDHKPGLVIAYDSEWMYPFPDNPTIRQILSYQFAYLYNDTIVEIVFLPKGNKRLNISDALSAIYCYYDSEAEKVSLDTRKTNKYKAEIITSKGVKSKIYDSRTEAKNAAGRTGKVETFQDISNDRYISICLLCHVGLVDITAFDKENLRSRILKKLSSIGKGLVSINEIPLNVPLLREDKHHKRILPIKLSVRDTFCQAPADFKSLEALGDSVGLPKLMLDSDKEVDKNLKSRMGDVLVYDPNLYMEYASNDSVVTLLYAASLYGVNMVPKITITSAAASVMYNTIARYLEVNPNNIADFNRVYRGLKKIDKGLIATNRNNIPYITASELEPINFDTHKVQYMASLAYHGGYNSCSDVGYITEPTFDYDLKNAYPTAQCLIPDIDWEQPIKTTLTNISLQQLGQQYFEKENPLPLMLAYIENFSFPITVKFPNIPVMVKGVPVYPLNHDAKTTTIKDIPSICITGPELYLAYKLGCEARISECYLLNPLEYEEETNSGVKIGVCKSLSAAVKLPVSDRAKSPKDTLCNKILKIMVTSGYGKTSQNIINKRSWNADEEDMEDSIPSIVSNPVAASFTTAIVRSLLIASQNEIYNAGYKVYSVTTDGFISNVPEDILKSMNLYGFTSLMNEARLFLTDNKSKEIWEIKHRQCDLLNFTTRGNISLSSKGVCAHNSSKSGFPKGSYEDRLWLMNAVLNRTCRVKYEDSIWTTFKDIILGLKDDFCILPVTKYKSMDFDLKRKPIRSSFKTVYPLINGVSYEIANFSTEPYLNVEEFNLYRSQHKNIVGESEDNSPAKPARMRLNFPRSNTKIKSEHCLRTIKDWDTYFFSRIEKAKRRKKRTVNVSDKLSIRTSTITVNVKKKAIHTDSSVDLAARKVYNCMYAYRAGKISIPLIEQYSPREFISALNRSKLSRKIFTYEGYKNYGRKERWPDVLTNGTAEEVEAFLSEQEPILTKLRNLTLLNT